MKKTILSALIAVFSFVTQVTAQSSILATLHHNGEIKTFYGTSAFSEANKAASDGDVITLSGGTFNAPTDTITKAITVRGAGMELDTLNNIEPTIINGALSLNIPESAASKFILEAIYLDTIRYCGTLKSPQFIKSRIDYVNSISINDKIVDAQFLHCIISHYFSLSPNSSATLVSCYVKNPSCINSKNSNFELQNCVIYITTPNYIENSLIRNSIIIYVNGGGNSDNKDYYALPQTTVAYNCVGVWTGKSGYIYGNSPGYLFVFQTNTSNTELTKRTSSTKIFKNWNFYSVDYLQNFKDTRLELAESFKSKYKGTDGTEVGIYGGKLPFDAVSTNPRITKCEVDGKTTADGKLSIKVEVNGKN